MNADVEYRLRQTAEASGDVEDLGPFKSKAAAVYAAVSMELSQQRDLSIIYHIYATEWRLLGKCPVHGSPLSAAFHRQTAVGNLRKVEVIKLVDYHFCNNWPHEDGECPNQPESLEDFVMHVGGYSVEEA